MGKRTVVLLVALVLAALSAIAVWRFLTQVEDDARKGLDEVTVFRATSAVERGSLGNDVLVNFAESKELEEFLPENAITSQAQLEETLRGKVARGPISKGQVVTTDLWALPEQEVATFSELIEPGHQALSIRPDEVRAVGGFIRPGDRVNLIAALDVDRTSTLAFLGNPIGRRLLGVNDEFDAFLAVLPEEQRATEGQALIDQLVSSLPPVVPLAFTALQSVDVLSVGSVLLGETTPSTTSADGQGVAPQVEALGSQLVTLQVTGEQAERIVWLFQNSTVWLTLLPADEDYQPFETEGVVLEDIINGIIQSRTLELFGVASP